MNLKNININDGMEYDHVTGCLAVIEKAELRVGLKVSLSKRENPTINVVITTDWGE